jgi:hypothetical protein
MYVLIFGTYIDASNTAYLHGDFKLFLTCIFFYYTFAYQFII